MGRELEMQKYWQLQKGFEGMATLTLMLTQTATLKMISRLSETELQW